jgi:phospholipase C
MDEATRGSPAGLGESGDAAVTASLHRDWLRPAGSLLVAFLFSLGGAGSGCNCCPPPPPGGGMDGGGDANDGSDGDGAVEDATDAGDARDTGISVDGPIECMAGQSMCNGSCVDTTVDDDNCGGCGHTCSGETHCGAGFCQLSPIRHVVLIVQENHTFDSYFGRYCQAPAHSNPSCTNGRACCEAAPATEPRGASPGILDDSSNFADDRDHAQGCELQQIDDGAMDQYVSGASYPCMGSILCCATYPSCSDPNNWVLAEGAMAADPLHYYWALADNSALADRYFQPIAGGTASNDMYFAGARFQFVDNAKMPDVTAGVQPSAPYGLCIDQLLHCVTTDHAKPPYTGDIGTLLLTGGHTFTVYADGFAEAAAAAQKGQCADPTSVTECPYNDCVQHQVACNGCLYDPTDIPFLYFDTFQDTAVDGGVAPTIHEKDYAALAYDLQNNGLPAFAYVKARVFHNEHPNFSTISDGAAFVQQTIQAILASPSASSTLVLLTWDEGGGFFDHISPPAALPASVDHDDGGAQVPYGTRVPLIAVGSFAARGVVSHVQMEHSSIVKFLEYTFLGNARIGALGARDDAVNNIGSLLDRATTVIQVPER